MSTKVCTKCKQEKDISDFHKKAKTKDGLRYECKTCRREYGKARYLKIKSFHAKYHLMRTYGISLEEYNHKLENQRGVCAICTKPCSTGNALAVDHNHKTGKIRGLLCFSCNRRLGIFENKEFISKAIQYLLSYKEDHLVSFATNYQPRI